MTRHPGAPPSRFDGPNEEVLNLIRRKPPLSPDQIRQLIISTDVTNLTQDDIVELLLGEARFEAQGARWLLGLPRTIGQLPASVQRIMQVTLLLVAIALGEGHRFIPRAWESIAPQAPDILPQDMDEPLEISQMFRNPILDIPQGEDEARVVGEIKQRIAEALFVQDEKGLEPFKPASLAELDERLSAVQDQMLILSIGHIPPDFWETFSEEEQRLIRRSVRYLVFGKSMTRLSRQDWIAPPSGISIGNGVVLIDSRIGVSGAYAPVFRGLVLHEATHEHEKSQPLEVQVPRLRDEQGAYEVQLTYLERVYAETEGETQRIVGYDEDQVRQALAVATFLIEHYGHLPNIEKLHPGGGIQAVHFLVAGIRAQDLSSPRRNAQPAQTFAVNAARHALGQLESLRSTDGTLDDLLDIARQYRDSFYDYGNPLDIAIADQLMGIYLFLNPDAFEDELEEDFAAMLRRAPPASVSFKGNKLQFLRRTQRVLPFDPSRQPAYTSLCENGPKTLTELRAQLATFDDKKLHLLKDIRRKSAILYQLGYHALQEKSYEEAYSYLLDYITMPDNWHLDFETHVVMMRLIVLLRGKGSPPPQGWEALERRMRHFGWSSAAPRVWGTPYDLHRETAYRLNSLGTRAVYSQLFEYDEGAGGGNIEASNFKHIPAPPSLLDPYLCRLPEEMSRRP